MTTRSKRHAGLRQNLPVVFPRAEARRAPAGPARSLPRAQVRRDGDELVGAPLPVDPKPPDHAACAAPKGGQWLARRRKLSWLARERARYLDCGRDATARARALPTLARMEWLGAAAPT